MEDNIQILEKRAENAQILGKAVGLLRQLKSTPNIGLTRTFYQIDTIIDELNKCEKQIIFVAWGAFAHNKLINIYYYK